MEALKVYRCGHGLQKRTRINPGVDPSHPFPTIIRESEDRCRQFSRDERSVLRQGPRYSLRLHLRMRSRTIARSSRHDASEPFSSLLRSSKSFACTLLCVCVSYNLFQTPFIACAKLDCSLPVFVSYLVVSTAKQRTLDWFKPDR